MNSDTFINGITGLGLTKYLKPEGPGFFVFGGVGLAVMQEFTGGEDDSGFGLIGGIGYDISKHCSIQGDIIYTNYAGEWQSVGVRVTVNFLAF